MLGVEEMPHPLRPGRGDALTAGTARVVEPIIGAKLMVPEVRPTVLVRQRLLDRLTEAARGPLTLIVAPAGSGKTVLASSWAAAGLAPGPVSWVTLDEEDGRPATFWRYVLAGLARAGLSPAGGSDAYECVDRGVLVRLAAGLSAAAEPVVLVVDHAERLTGSRLGAEIDFVLRRSGGRLRLVLAGRAEPDLPLHQYRLDGSLAEIRFADLAFTAAEVAGLLGGAGPADPAVVTRLAHSRGWAAGLRLAGADLAAYFRAEVLAGLPGELRHVLLSTCVVDRLPPGLAGHLSGDPEATVALAGLAAAGGFVEPEPAGFGYHPMTRDLLRTELQAESAARRRALHRKAACWLADAGRTEEAAGQYAAARDWSDAAALLVADLAVGRLLAAPPGRGLAGALAGLPADTPLPETAVVAAALALGRRDHQECGRQLARAAELARGGADQPDLRLAIATVGAALAAATGAAGSAFEAAAAAGAALAELAAAGRPAPPELPALLGASVGRAHLATGDLEAARAALTAASRSPYPPGCERLRAACLADLACTEALTGRLRRATALATRATTLTATGPADPTRTAGPTGPAARTAGTTGTTGTTGPATHASVAAHGADPTRTAGPTGPATHDGAAAHGADPARSAGPAGPATHAGAAAHGADPTRTTGPTGPATHASAAAHGADPARSAGPAGPATHAGAAAHGADRTRPAGAAGGAGPAAAGPGAADPGAADPVAADPVAADPVADAVRVGGRPPVAELALAWVDTERGDARRGRRHADAAAAGGIGPDPVAGALLALVDSRLLRARGDFGGAVAVLAAARTGPARPPRWLVSRLEAAEAVLLVAQGRPGAALAAVERAVLPDAAEIRLARGWALLATGAAAAAGRAARLVLRQDRLPLDLRVDALLLAAGGELDLSRPEAARAALGRAVRLAEPERLRRPFQQAQPRVRRALREQERRGAAGILHTAATPVAPADAIVQPLTEREREVLAYLAALLPTEEIAAAMFVSVNTVKTHVRAILRKLSVQRRNDAVRRARELGLV
jgi:ATP/maltotriose-dependent transcriptional regulator MalT